MKYLITCLALCLLTAKAIAAAPDGSFAVDGPGSQPCSSFVQALESDNKTATIAYAAWTEGFTTGVNVFREQTFDITPWQTTSLLLAKMRAFCQNNPDMAYVDALGRLIATLMRDRLGESSPLVQTRYKGKAVALPAAIVQRVRAALQQQGATISSPQGGFDQSFADALIAYQKAHALVPTGLPDQPTLNALFP